MGNHDYTVKAGWVHTTPTKSVLKKYGITPEDYEKRLEEQDHCCAICGQHESKFKKRLAVEHNHCTEFVRGLTCDYCNRKRVGSMSDSKQIWAGMLKYIRNALKEDLTWK